LLNQILIEKQLYLEAQDNFSEDLTLFCQKIRKDNIEADREFLIRKKINNGDE